MRGVNMTAGSAKTQAPKARKRVDVDPSLLKRSIDGSAFTRCENCNKDIAVATFDMHDCKTDAKTKAMTSKMKKDDAAETKANDDRVGTKRKAEPKEPKEPKEKVTKLAKKATKKSKKAAKDPNAPKRPSSGFFIFMETYRKTYKEENPDAKGIAAVGKAGGEKWKQMTEEEKAPYNKEAAARKATYETAKKKYDQKGDDDEPEVSEEASKSEVQDEAEDDEEAADDDE